MGPAAHGRLAGRESGHPRRVVLRGDHPIVHWDEERSGDVLLLDVREVKEFEKGHVDGAVNIPLSELRARLDEVPTDRDIWVYCAVGQRAYYATRALLQRGRQVRNLSGGYQSAQAAGRQAP